MSKLNWTRISGHEGSLPEDDSLVLLHSYEEGINRLKYARYLREKSDKYLIMNLPDSDLINDETIDLRTKPSFPNWFEVLSFDLKTEILWIIDPNLIHTHWRKVDLPEEVMSEQEKKAFEESKENKI